MEIVTEPDISSAEEARKYLEKLRNIMRYLGVSDADMEKGQLRCDVNISLKPKGSEKLGTKVELKN
jgi:Asp-tRNAAsn/Glu-tRNAGln amidotransferase B subunit (PET112 homolog)